MKLKRFVFFFVVLVSQEILCVPTDTVETAEAAKHTLSTDIVRDVASQVTSSAGTTFKDTISRLVTQLPQNSQGTFLSILKKFIEGSLPFAAYFTNPIIDELIANSNQSKIQPVAAKRAEGITEALIYKVLWQRVEGKAPEKLVKGDKNGDELRRFFGDVLNVLDEMVITTLDNFKIRYPKVEL